jgi:hypothetical protein
MNSVFAFRRSQTVQVHSNQNSHLSVRACVTRTKTRNLNVRRGQFQLFEVRESPWIEYDEVRARERLMTMSGKRFPRIVCGKNGKKVLVCLFFYTQKRLVSLHSVLFDSRRESLRLGPVKMGVCCVSSIFPLSLLTPPTHKPLTSASYPLPSPPPSLTSPQCVRDFTILALSLE